MTTPWLIAIFLSCSPPPEPVPQGTPELTVPSPAEWPEYGSRLRRVEPTRPPVKEVRRVYVDAGHGAPGNEGNHGAWCQLEQDHTLDLGRALVAALDAHPNLVARSSRTGADRPSYSRRLRQATSWKADLLISLHSDARGDAGYVQTSTGDWCLQNPGDPGYAVLWSSQGPLAPHRHRLARVLSQHLSRIGLPPYSGIDYGGLYESDAVVPAVFRDLRGLMMLRRPVMPSVILETHHALNPNEADRWEEPHVVDAFSRAVAGAVVEYFWPPEAGDPS